MALARFVLTATVTLTPEATAAISAAGVYAGDGLGTGSGGASTGAASAGKYGWLPAALIKGTVIYADSAAGLTTGLQVLYQAIGAANLRADVQGTDDIGHAGVSN